MVDTISPAVHGGKRNLSYWSSVALHIVGATLSAALLGALLALAGNALGAPWDDVGNWVLAGIALVYALGALLRLPIPVPALSRQVPSWWRTFFSKRVTAFLYGLGLGVGYYTHLSFGTFVVVSVAAFVGGDVAWGAALCGTFGFVRAALVLVASSVRDEELAQQMSLRLEDLAGSPLQRATNGLALMATAAIAVL